MEKILVVRNDKLGDFVLAFPAFAMLKQSLPQAQIVALVPSYTADLAKSCPYLDDVIIDTDNKKDKVARQSVLNTIKAYNFTAVIAFFSNRYNACLLWQTHIPYRLAPATKIVQFLYNHRLTQRRSRSQKAEFVYNLDLSRAFLQDKQIPIKEPTFPYLSFSSQVLVQQKQKLSGLLGLQPAKKWCFLHSGTGGSAKNLILAQYAQLAKGILAKFDCQIVLTAGKGEEESALTLAQLINDPNVVVYSKNDGLSDFAHSIACCDLFIAGSTGPLHLAAALNKPTIGFFPSKRSACALRWQPINDPAKQLLISADPAIPETQQMQQIDIQRVLAQAIPFIQTVWS